jgi:chromosome segregation ATPase
MEQITLIRKALGDKPAEEVSNALSELEKALSSVEDSQKKVDEWKAKFDELAEEKREVERDMMAYKGKHSKATKRIDELQSEVEQATEQLTAFETEKTELADLRTKFADIQAQEEIKLRESYAGKLEALKGKPVFDKIKEKLTVPTEENPLDKLAFDDVKASVSKISEWEELGWLEVSDSRTTGNSQDAEASKSKFENALDNAFSRKKG